jgi:hypothetical protein
MNSLVHQLSGRFDCGSPGASRMALQV